MTQMQREDIEKKAKAYRQRLGFARKGVQAFRRGDYKSAMESYVKYFEGVEIAHDRLGQGIDIELFDKKRDAGEMLLVASIAFDMMRIYDRGTSPEHETEFKKSVEMFVKFTKGMTYQPALAEQLRRFLLSQTGKVRHRVEFKKAYADLRVKLGRCYIATYMFGYDHPMVTALHGFRDNFLKKHRWGRRLIDFYYLESSAFVAYRKLRKVLSER